MDGEVQPTALSATYRVRIEYMHGVAPRVWVLTPKLRDREGGKRLEHVYRDPDGRLRPCLYHPGKNEWRQADLISRTIVPWLLEWLFFYEDWLITGEWSGGGEHPDPDETRPVPRERRRPKRRSRKRA